MIHFWRDLPVAFAAIPQTLFLLLYSLPMFGAGPWWRDFTGRALFLKALTLALLLDTATLGYVAGLLAGAELVYGWPADNAIDAAIVVLYWLVAAAITYQFAALVRSRIHARRRRTHRARTADNAA